jgi:cytoskeletal protein CcmA (bactofilin family)
MKYPPRRLPPLLACLFVSVVLSTAAFADADHDRTQVGNNITIGPNEEVSEATCFGCSIRIRGQVAGDVTAFGGSIVVEDQGQVGGDATTFGGDIRIDKAGSVNRDVTVFGGRLRRDPGARVGGDVTNMGGPGWMVLIFLSPFIFLGLFVALVVWVIRRLLRPAVPATA